jgi:Trypsin-co-occurring domain 1
MKHLVAFPLEEGGNIVIEIDEPETGGTVRAGREETIEKAKETFEEALNKVLPATKTVVEKLRTMASRPDEIEVTFGINLSTMAGAFIASASAAANFGVTVRWAGKTEGTSRRPDGLP